MIFVDELVNWDKLAKHHNLKPSITLKVVIIGNTWGKLTLVTQIDGKKNLKTLV